MNAKQQARICKIRIIICLVVSVIVILSSATSVFAADGWKADESSKAAGYYAGDETSIVLMGNDIMYQIQSEDASMSSIPFSLQSDGNDYVICTEDDNYLALHKQDKEKTEDGGVYFALYAEYVGPLDSTDYKEGKQVEFGGQVFGNDYDVVIRYPLTKFFGEDFAAPDITGMIEGPGFDTPEEALKAYIQGLIDNDIDEMLSAFAVETYIENVDAKMFIERNQAYQLGINYIPTISDYSYRLNLENRRHFIITMIRAHYLILTNSENSLSGSAMLSDYDSIDDMYQSLFKMDDSKYMSSITFKGEFYDPDYLTNGTYDSENMKETLERNAKYNGATDYESVVATIYCNGEPILLGIDAGMYNDKWYLVNTGSGVAMTILGNTYYMQGMQPYRLIDDQELLDKLN